MSTIVATRCCTKCGQTKPLHAFRRWRGAYRTLHETCNVCGPERRIEKITDPEQRAAVAHIRDLSHAQRLRAEAKVEREKEEQRQRAARKAQGLHQLTRRRAWDEAVVGKVREEWSFSRGKLDSLRNQQDIYTAPPDAPMKAGMTNQQRSALDRANHFNAHTWIPFYEYYVPLLHRVYTELKHKKNTIGEKLKPTEEETKLTYYLTKEEIQTLRKLYSDGVIPRAVRFRTPLVIAEVSASNQRGQATPFGRS